MSKTLLRTLIIALPLFAVLGSFNRSASLETSEKRLARAAPKNYVEVTFDGLMVARKVGTHYEVGILDKNTATDHEFRITVGKKHLDASRIAALMALGNSWTLSIETSSGPKAADIKPRQVKSCNRLNDTINGQVDLEHVFDFCWIMDLESEFYGGRELPLIPGKLKPIIKLNNGELYTKYNYDELVRTKGSGGTWTDFGFIAETIGLRVHLLAGEQLVLRVGKGEQGVAFRLPQGGSRNAGIFNALTGSHPENASHFPLYYGLFSNVANDQKFDIKPKEPGLRPLNRWFYPDRVTKRLFEDDIRHRTFDNQSCGLALLGKSTNKPLE